MIESGRCLLSVCLRSKWSKHKKYKNSPIFYGAILWFGYILFSFLPLLSTRLKLGGIGVGMAGGLGMAVAVFIFGIPPGPMPLDVILIIMSVLFACSVMHVAGGMDYMIRVASHILLQ